ncbi:hypothetical protein PMZ80_008753 [Knufia obscura]|uniref:Protein kinase domain-containing protein n=1 Tax=Knufia obscura TaxID=1635080 RepID=A0ABR0RD49_9EURO|nr:hypothetical protein PMZ80_008753 [Knufia obscura]
MPANEGCEDLEKYRPRGLHPIRIGDTLKTSRYTIVHKLGFGNSSTVWLARDDIENRLVAVKVLTANASRISQEIAVQRFLLRLMSPGSSNLVTKILDHFVAKGVNGRHLCIVFELAGPSLQVLLKDAKIRPDHVRKLSRDIAQGVAGLHSSAIAFGDLSTANVLLRFAEMSSWELDVVYAKLGQPTSEPLVTIEGKEACKQYAPSTTCLAIDYQTIALDVIAPSIRFADLNEAVHTDQELVGAEHAKPSAVNLPYGSPERLFGISPRHSKASDVSALACCFFELRTNTQLVNGDSPSIFKQALQILLGPLPEQWLESIKVMEGDETESIIPPEEFQYIEDTLEARIRNVGDWSPWHTMSMEERCKFVISDLGEEYALSSDCDLEAQVNTGPPPPARLSEEELVDFYDLLSKMLRYLPEERITIQEVLDHPWLHKTYTDLDPPADWLSRFDWGRETREVDYDLGTGLDILDQMLAEQQAGTQDAADGHDLDQIEDSDSDGIESKDDVKQEQSYDKGEEIYYDALEYQDTNNTPEEVDQLETRKRKLLGEHQEDQSSARDTTELDYVESKKQKNCHESSERLGSSVADENFFVTKLLGLPINDDQTQ